MKRFLRPKIALLGGLIIGCTVGPWYSGNRSTSEVFSRAKAEEQGGRQELDRLLQERYQTAKGLLEVEEKRLREGVTTLQRVCEAARWVRDSALELPVSVPERLRALTEYVEWSRRLEASVKRSVDQGAAPSANRESARYLRLDAEIMLLRVQLEGNRETKGTPLNR